MSSITNRDYVFIYLLYFSTTIVMSTIADFVSTINIIVLNNEKKTPTDSLRTLHSIIDCKINIKRSAKKIDNLQR